MAREIRAFDVTIPAGTTSDAPYQTALTFPVRTVTEINIRIPPGPSGTMGFAIQNSGDTIIPYNNGDWIITDNEVMDWPLTNFIESGSWGLIGYNTGSYDHTVYLRFLLDVAGLPATPAIGAGLINAAQLSSA